MGPPCPDVHLGARSHTELQTPGQAVLLATRWRTATVHCELCLVPMNPATQREGTAWVGDSRVHPPGVFSLIHTDFGAWAPRESSSFSFSCTGPHPGFLGITVAPSSQAPPSDSIGLFQHCPLPSAYHKLHSPAGFPCGISLVTSGNGNPALGQNLPLESSLTSSSLTSTQAAP